MNIQNVIDNENLQDDRSKLQTIAKHYGIEDQIKQTIEEMSKLTTALCKQLRHKCPQPSLNVIEEMADVSIMLEQLIYLFDCKKQVDNIKIIKIQRQIERMRC